MKTTSQKHTLVIRTSVGRGTQSSLKLSFQQKIELRSKQSPSFDHKTTTKILKVTTEMQNTKRQKLFYERRAK